MLGIYLRNIFCPNGEYVLTSVYSKISKYYLASKAVFDRVYNFSTYRYYSAATGNSTMAIIGGGTNGSIDLNICDSYTYVNNVINQTTNMTYSTRTLVAFSSTTIGYFQGGITVNTKVANTSTYTYSDATVIAGTRSNYNRTQAAAVNTTTFGLIGSGAGTTYNNQSNSLLAITEKYTYSNNTVANGTNLSYSKYWLSGAGNTTLGVFFGGNNSGGTPQNTSNRYTYSNNTVATGTTLNVARSGGQSAGDNTNAIIVGGNSTEYRLEIYNYSNNTFTYSTYFAHNYSSGGSTCTTPGGLY